MSAIDPDPEPGLVALDNEQPELELVRETSLEALPRIPMPDAVIIDGDHNYFTVSEELRLIGERAPGTDIPLLFFHDVCWPHARRDDYFAPELIPDDYRHPLVGSEKGLFPGEPGVVTGGVPYPKSAAQEGGPRNGVLTAVEDFVADREGLRLAVVPAFFGFGVVWHEGASYASGLAEILDGWDRNPVVERLEGNRVYHIAQAHQRQSEIWKLQERQARQEALLRRLLESSAFSVADRLSRLRKRAGVATEPVGGVQGRDPPRPRGLSGAVLGPITDRASAPPLVVRCSARSPMGLRSSLSGPSRRRACARCSACAGVPSAARRGSS